MRILFCGINFSPDQVGVAKYNSELCEWLAAAGHELRVITAPPYYPRWSVPSVFQGWRYRREDFHGMLVRRAPIYVPGKPTGPRRLLHHASFALTSAGPVMAEAMRWRPHLMFSVAPSMMSAAAMAIMARRLRIPSWLHVQDFEIDAAFDLGLLRSRALRKPMVVVERKILRSFDRVSTIAPQMLERLKAKGVPAERLREVRNWTDTVNIRPGERLTRFRKELGLTESDVVALYSGTMSRKQGLELIIEAAPELGRTHPHVHFVFCGEGPHKSRLSEMASRLRNLHFTGLQPESRLSELLNTADIHLVPQRAEAAELVLPSKLGGIFASGRPVITMAVEGSGLAREAQSAGLLVSPGDVDGLTAAIRKLADDPGLRGSLGGIGRERALANWDKAAILGRLEAELRALCETSDQVQRFGRPLGWEDCQPGRDAVTASRTAHKRLSA